MTLGKAAVLLAQAQAEQSQAATQKLLYQALNLALASIRSGKEDKTRVAARVLAEIAVTEMSPSRRRRAWTGAIRILGQTSKDKEVPGTVGLYADIVIDASQDPYADLYEEFVRSRLASARKRLNALTRSDCRLPALQQGYLLARLSAVRRAQALTQLSFSDRRHAFLEALDIVNYAIAIQPKSAPVQLELANCYWALSRYAESDEQYASDLAKTEQAFVSARDSADLEVAGYSLARFYRLTHQAPRACDEFAGLISRVRHRRRLLRESYIFAEAVQHLWYIGHPEEHIKPLLAQAIELLTAAIDSGCLYARHIVDLATLHAMQGDSGFAETILTRELVTKNQRFDWNTIVNAITSSKFLEARVGDLPGLGFALGLNSPVILNKLGTYCRDFLADRELAGVFYSASLRIDRRNSITLTNKARLLLDLGDPQDFKEVRALLDRAKVYADRRYTWWRHELNRLILAKGGNAQGSEKREPSKGALISFRQRRLAFYNIDSMSDPNERGLKFEHWFADLIAVSFTEYVGSHRSPGAQNDAFFFHKSIPFRVEAKWEAKPVPAKPLREFNSRIQLPVMAGVFISMSGFKKAAVDYCRTIMRERCLLLMDGDELRSVVEGDVSLLDLVDFKYVSFLIKENPYARFKRRAPG
ncbi:MAG TPA: restriction endonuclease [Pyrinomonadaceae bacterium]|nr:restriction endonuclease [Pyrinomonadaceae bacterium]